MADQITAATANSDGSYTFDFLFDSGTGVFGASVVNLTASHRLRLTPWKRRRRLSCPWLRLKNRHGLRHLPHNPSLVM
jgi:hypothetical protein